MGRPPGEPSVVTLEGLDTESILDFAGMSRCTQGTAWGKRSRQRAGGDMIEACPIGELRS